MLTYKNQPDPNTDWIIKGEWVPGEAIWWQSKCRQALENTYQEYAVRVVKDAGMTDPDVMMQGHGLEICIVAHKNGKKHGAHFHVNGSVIADIWNWAEAL